MVYQATEGCPDVSVARLQAAQAQVNVVANDRKILVKPAQLVKQFPPNHQAGAGVGRHFANALIQVLVNPVTRQLFVKQMAGTATMVDQKHTTVLNSAIGIQQHAADRSCVRAYRMTCHFSEPVIVHHFNVVIQEQQQVTLAVIDANIVQP